ncbi:MAG: hypothetical protein H6513_11385 [Acidimicrobiaceae bacterium]|nr:hypothetical protein [Ilumatobacter sp.]MCB9381280.1 hypothetical protein [Acidimicrobiaceae bacterium]MCO5331645.1 hypothetical protein [Ilumatobacteraceae bacterium]
MDAEVVARDVGHRLQLTLERLSTLARGLAVLALLVGAATFATGWWIFDGSRPAWLVIGGVICLVPVGAAAIAWFVLRGAAAKAPTLVQDVHQFVDTSVGSAQVLLDHDSGLAIGTYGKSLGALRAELNERRKELPGLWAGVRAITTVPGLAGLTVLGIVGVGLLGTILMIGGLID